MEADARGELGGPAGARRLRSFRTAVALTTVALFLLAVGLAVVSAVRPAWMPLCFAPQGMGAVVCPTSAAPKGGATTTPPSTAEVERR